MKNRELLEQVAQILSTELGLSFPETRYPELTRAVERVSKITENRFSTEEILLSIVSNRGIPSSIYKELSTALTIGETYFFRESVAMEFIKEVIIPSIKQSSEPYVVWSAGCSSGEEPYSIAMLLHERLSQDELKRVKIYATDINDTAINKARRGLYREWSFRETPSLIRERYFTEEGLEWKLSEEIIKMVEFSHHNLFSDNNPGFIFGEEKINLILCRNVLIYFSLQNINKVANRFHKLLKPSGWLITSQVELNNQIFNIFLGVRYKQALFYKKELADGESSAFQKKYGTEERKQKRTETINPPKHKTALKSQITEPRSAQHIITGNILKEASHNDFREASMLAGRGEFDKAIEILKKLIAQDASNAEYYYLYGIIYDELNESQKALDMLKKALYLEHTHIAAMYTIALIYKRSGKIKVAHRYFTDAFRNLIQMDPDAVIKGGGGLTASRLAEIIKQEIWNG